ncbi:SGNH/GDSL hydrolase family protein [Sphingopyxis panaciterrulae]|uniref:Lysophospholipase L1-like esterase n=1 Tax=Sphingopyxis panaciterrulae TaxID=462372 RepID=A0A7W9EPV8_9SPHN|nr:SGNH/GDSL hydrolase family protein [Sphingopyxis panaciterrulae]MBB5705869.1 lysophospholipase L1-like esterase [Sphingopyxis panaciterrulae]
MIRPLFMPLLALTLAGAAPTERPAFAPLAVHVGGRTAAAADSSLAFGWPGVYVEGRFHGTAVRVRFAAPTDHLRLSIDGTERAVFRAPGTVDTMLAGLVDGVHIVRLDKLTESQTGGSRFLGFAAAGAPLAPPTRARQIEFIGDSFSVGYGNLSPNRECSERQVHDLTDTTRAFGPLTARALDADYRIHAFSGFGMVRNYNGRAAGDSLPDRYSLALPGDPAPAAADADWHPDAIVINLGTNDFSTPVQASEPWADTAALKTAYRDRYAAFVTELAARQPQARFILMGSDLFFPEVAAVAATLQAGLPGRVTTLHFTGLDFGGCHAHPSLADHRRIADQLVRVIESR